MFSNKWQQAFRECNLWPTNVLGNTSNATFRISPRTAYTYKRDETRHDKSAFHFSIYCFACHLGQTGVLCYSD